MIRRHLTVLAATVTAGMCLLAICSPAQAAEPAGTGIDLPSITESGDSLTWSGTYSCDRGLLQTLTVQAGDDAGHTATETIPRLCLTPVTGAPISGTLTTGPLGLGPDWTGTVTVTATMRDVTGAVTAEATDALSGGHLSDLTIDDATSNTNGDVILSGTYQCAGAPLAITLTADTVRLPAVPAPCTRAVDTPATWTATAPATALSTVQPATGELDGVLAAPVTGLAPKEDAQRPPDLKAILEKLKGGSAKS